MGAIATRILKECQRLWASKQKPIRLLVGYPTYLLLAEEAGGAAYAIHWITGGLDPIIHPISGFFIESVAFKEFKMKGKPFDGSSIR